MCRHAKRARYPLPVHAAPPRIRWVRIALLLGAAVAAAWIGWGSGAQTTFVEREETFPLAEPATVRQWEGELQRRAGPWGEFPDPPGVGVVRRERYWISRAAYVMEVRRRGARVTLGISGVDPQYMGGAWTAFAEGWASGEGNAARPFAGCVVNISWSCLGVRFRHASDGMGRLLFSEDGESIVSTYMAYEAPESWAKAYGVRAVGERPDYAVLRGQIPITPALARLQDEAVYRVRVCVRDVEGGVLAGALVQLKGRPATQALTDTEGQAQICFRGSDAPIGIPLTAGATGHRNGERVLFAGDPWPGLIPDALSHECVDIVLERLPAGDSSEYVWVRPAGDLDPDDAMACGTCHQWHYEEWSRSRHATMASNGLVAYERQRMLRALPDALDDCRGCHQPGEALDQPGPGWRARGTLAGNHCDFCHKVHHVSDLRESGAMGALSLRRPAPGDRSRPGGIHLVFGSMADVTYAYMGAAWNPLFQSSHLCAACHQGGGAWRQGRLPKVDTFEEWRRWATSRPDAKDVRSCQDCHMPAAQTVSADGTPVDQLAWDSLHRRPQDVHEHRFLGSSPPYAASALRLVVEKEVDQEGGRLRVTVRLTNAGAGHRVPTGTWSKHVLVGVWARQAGAALRQTAGERAWVVPADQSEEAPESGDWRNPAGFVLGVFARQDPEGRAGLLDWWSEVAPEEVLDRRLAPGEARSGEFSFALPARDAGEPAPQEPEVEVWVVHRRAPLGAGIQTLPWSPGAYEDTPETLWMRVVR